MSREEREHEYRKGLILDAARELIFAHGFDEASMEDIAKAAGYTRRTLYSYFQSREEIGLAVFLEGLRQRHREQQAAVAAAGDGLDKVRAWGEALAAFSREHPQYLRIQLYWDYKGIDESRIHPVAFDEFRALNEEIIAGLRASFEAGVRDGTIRRDLSIDAVISQYAYCLRAILSNVLFPRYTFACFEPAPYIEQYLDLFTDAIRSR